jgi:hypothetical protein
MTLATNAMLAVTTVTTRPQSAEDEFLGRMRGHLTRVEEAAFE